MSLRTKILRELEKKPHSARQLKDKLGNNRKVLETLDEMVRGREVLCESGIYALNNPKTQHAVTCRLVKLGRGFGFAKPEDGSLDVFIPGRFLKGAMPGDTVKVTISEHPRVAGSVEGEVLAVLDENNRFVGTVARQDGKLVLVPDNCPACPLQIKKSADGGAREGEKAAVEILERGETHEDHRAGVCMRFGSADEARQCAKAILYGAGIERQFPQKVKAEAKLLEDAKVLPADLAGREDLRELPIFTIDSASTKDIDDAISAQRSGKGYTVGVHIADVSHYVQAGSALDAEAMRRGTSVYYGDSVVHMLPHQLSNGICSLNEGEDRLAFSCFLQLDAAARVTDCRFVKSVIRSRVKGVYSEINAIYDGTADAVVAEKYREVAKELPLLREIYEKLAKLRAQRGALDIESGEAKLTFDEDGRCVNVEKRERGLSEQMIEEFMLLANSGAASLARRMEIPFVYRVHEKPDPERIESLKKALDAAGVAYHFEGMLPTTLELAQLLEKTRGTPLERFVHTNVLRSMAKAKYEPTPKGHYGLALEDYAHFTSPIRRYPDLSIHRILTDVCAGDSKETLVKRYTGFAAAAATQSSDCELIAMKAERDTEDCYKAEYMRQFIGQTFDGVISSVTSFGVYVELPNTVEGLVRAAALSQRPMMLTDGVSLADPASGKTWRLGDSIRVKLEAVDVSQGNLDFGPTAD